MDENSMMEVILMVHMRVTAESLKDISRLVQLMLGEL